jgi:hypothetical protein
MAHAVPRRLADILSFDRDRRLSPFCAEVKIKVKGDGQECPSHMGCQPNFSSTALQPARLNHFALKASVSDMVFSDALICSSVAEDFSRMVMGSDGSRSK